MGFWRKEFSNEEINFILDQIRQFRVLQDDGRIALKGSGVRSGWQNILVSAAGFSVRTDALRTQIIQGVLFSPELPMDFSEEDFRTIVYKLRHKYQDQNLKTYRVAFPLWNLPGFLRGMKKLDDVTLNFNPSQKTKIFKTVKRERENQRSQNQFKSFFSKERIDDLHRCSICLAHVIACSAADANERASDALYETLGLVNLAADGSKSWRWSFRGGGKLPVSDVLIGPHTTVHFENGKLAFEGFWSENWVGGPNQKN